jgi:glycosyltransferase involved in cell wall biosynthesis
MMEHHPRGDAVEKTRVVALSAPGGFSGLPDAVLREFADHCRIVSVIDGLWTPRSARGWIALCTFRARRKHWGRFYYARLGRYIKRPATLLARIRRCEREIARLECPYDLIYQFGALFGVLRRPRNVPIVIQIDFTTRLAERYYPDWAPQSHEEAEAWNVIEGSIYREADLILVTTDLVSDSLVYDYGVIKDRIAVVGMGAHVEMLLEDFAKSMNRVLLFAGHDFDRHGGQVAVQIYQGIRQHLPDVVLKALTNRSVSATGAENVGIVSRPRLTGILREASVLLMPGSVGGYQTVTEAMAAKCLCIVAESNPHMRGLIKHGETGLTFSPARPAEVIQQIVEYLRHPDRLRVIGENARQHVLKNCLWSQVVARIWKEMDRRFSLSTDKFSA